MFLWCPECDSIYDTTLSALNEKDIIKGFDRCPKPGCSGDLVHIDELMLPIIRTLNKKGYSTEFCCSGHVNEESSYPYVAFEALTQRDKEQLIKIFLKYPLPKPWFIELNNMFEYSHSSSNSNPNDIKLPYDYMSCYSETDESYSQFTEEVNNLILEASKKDRDDKIIIRAKLELWNDWEDRWYQYKDFDTEIIQDRDLYKCDCNHYGGITEEYIVCPRYPDRCTKDKKLEALVEKNELIHLGVINRRVCIHDDGLEVLHDFIIEYFNTKVQEAFIVSKNNLEEFIDYVDPADIPEDKFSFIYNSFKNYIENYCRLNDDFSLFTDIDEESFITDSDGMNSDGMNKDIDLDKFFIKLGIIKYSKLTLKEKESMEYRKILKANASLMNWAIHLPDINYLY